MDRGCRQLPYGVTHGLRELEGTPIDRATEEQATLDALRAEYDRLQAEYEDADELPEEVDERLGEIDRNRRPGNPSCPLRSGRHRARRRFGQHRS